MIEKNFDVPFVANIAAKEKQIQQNYRPIIAVHKWFARRPGTLFRSLLLSEFVSESLKKSYYKPHNLNGIKVADPFMGGGTPLIEANRMGCEIFGYDINPMSYWIVKQELENINLNEYRVAAEDLRDTLEKKIGQYYTTKCTICGSTDALVKYFLWVKVINCTKCNKEISLFPGYLIAEDKRHPKNVILCHICGNLNEVEDIEADNHCSTCNNKLIINMGAKNNHCKCPNCGEINKFPQNTSIPPKHRMFAIEYFCKECFQSHDGRFFKKPDNDDIKKYNECEDKLNKLIIKYIPKDNILAGDETKRLYHWGYKKYKEMFNSRQLLGLELSCQIIEKQKNKRIRNALATNLSDLLRYQNMLCRYDTFALKSLDIFSIHGFPVGLIQCESNIIGINIKNVNIGSGGWSNIIDKYLKAKSYCENPYEFEFIRNKKNKVSINGEWIGDKKCESLIPEIRKINIACKNAAEVELIPESLDAVFTDPPYYGNVQYAELMDFCYVWLRRLVGKDAPEFILPTTRNINELTQNENMGRGIIDFTEGLSKIFFKMSRALKPQAPLAFTYHHNNIEAYYPIAIAILDSGLTCSATIPCPAEMGASIHINGTGSSVIDTIFVCRRNSSIEKRLIQDSYNNLVNLVKEDINNLIKGSIIPTKGDINCITYGHVIRLAVWSLKNEWNNNIGTNEKINVIKNWINNTFSPNISEIVYTDVNCSITEYISKQRNILKDMNDASELNAEIPF